MPLPTLKPRLQAASLFRLKPMPTAAVERKRGSAGVRDRHSIRERDCGLCQVCKRPGYIVDHIKPLCEGGSDDDSNKQLICSPCHLEKSAGEAARRAAGQSNT